MDSRPKNVWTSTHNRNQFRREKLIDQENRHAIEGRLKYPMYVRILGGYYTEDNYS